MRVRETGCKKPALPLDSLRSQRGFSLIELMVAMAIGLVIVGAVLYVYSGSRQAYNTQEDNARLQEGGRFALEILGRGIREAGFAALPLSNPVSTVTAFSGMPINGGDNCAAGGGPTATTDLLIVSSDAGTDCLGAASTAPPKVVNRYLISGTNLKCESLAPTLYDAAPANYLCSETNTGQPLVQDVEDMQILYGIDSDGSADQAADKYVTAAALTTAAQWNQVVSVRACVVVRSPNAGSAATAANYVDCTGASVANPDTRLRRAFTATFNLRDRINRIP